MKQDATEIAIVLDRSGSMGSVVNDTIGGFNRFLEDQKKVPGTARLTLAQFNTEYLVVHDGKNIGEVPPLNAETFVPQGGTALLDAIGKTINTTGKRLADMTDADRPAHIIFVIVTDGEENSSREFTHKQVLEQITHQREKYNWQFVFLGANQDAIAAGSSLGIGAGSSMTYANNAAGVGNTYTSLSANTRSLRTGVAKSMDFTAKDREAQKAAGGTT